MENLNVQHTPETGGKLLETMKLHAIIEVTHLIDSGKYDEACKVARACKRVASI